VGQFNERACDRKQVMITGLKLVLLATVVATLADDIVVLKHGRIKGHHLKSRKGREIFAFQGIPYAKPPVGELRFQV
jgi:acetylcholinesterase